MTPRADGRLPPAIAEDEVLAPSIGSLDAFVCAPSQQRCASQWMAVVYERPDITWTRTPIVVGDTVIVSTVGCVCGSGSASPVVTAYQLECATNGMACDPRWRWTFERARFITDLAVDDGIVYALTQGPGGRGPSEGIGLRIDCDGSCTPVVRLDLGAGSSRLWGTPFVTGGSLFVPRRAPGGLLAFDASCRGSCSPLREVSIGKRVSEVVPVQNKLLVTSGSDLLLYAMHPNADRWRPLWTWRGKGSIEQVVVRGNVAIVGLHQRTRAVRLPLRD